MWAVAAQPPKPTKTTRTMAHPAIIADRAVFKGLSQCDTITFIAVYLCSSARADESALSRAAVFSVFGSVATMAGPGSGEDSSGWEEPTTFGRGCRAAITAWR